MTAYAYQELPDPGSYIRILTLEKGDFDDPLRGSLSIVRLADKPTYEAISYCWGSSEKPYKIQLWDESSYLAFAITENLHLALRRLRLDSGQRRLWTDAICINQDEGKEKPHQIRQMTNIYCSAGAVLMYLGEEDDDSPEAFELIDRIYQAVKATPADDDRRALQWIRDNHLPLPTEPWAWEPLKAFFRRPWFQRKWIIQEATVASNATFFCGDWQADWNRIETVDQAVHKYGLAVNDHTTYDDLKTSTELQQGLAQIHALVNTKNCWRRDIRFQLMELLYRFQTARASKRHDHLYALLNLATEASDLAGDVNYDLSVAEVVENYAMFFLQLKGNIEVLYRAGLQGHQLLAPSWIPNWYGAHEGFRFEYAEGPWDYPRRQMLPKFYNVAPGTNMQVLEASKGVFGLKGCRIDRIAKLANIHLQGLSEALITKDLLLQQKRLHAEESDAIMNTLSSYPTGEPLTEVHWRTLICNVAYDLTRAPPDYEDSYRAWKRTLQYPPLTLASPEWRLQAPFRVVIDAYNGDKVFGLTENGYVGMFPRGAEAGDEVYLLYGGDFPFVLRKLEQEGYLQLVGQCYVHGIMEGQLDWRRYPPRNVYLAGPYESDTDATAIQ